ncbi:hypothetical protein [Lentzea roselyniae]|uniref:hypothetical protein n=1 Tax=Lentzea roselyniae TaxID=531940 RepID=UPI0031F9E7E9
MLGDPVPHVGERAGDVVQSPAEVERPGLLTEHNDVELLRRHGGAITLVAGDGPATALAPDGTVLIRVSGVRWHRREADQVELAVQTKVEDGSTTPSTC